MTATDDAGRVHLLGIRHLGPGSARSVLAALDELTPTAVLVELPADVTPMLTWVGRDDLRPPVALLAHRPGEGAGFWPMAEFSPEWQAILWARRHGAAVVAIDLPSAAMLDDERAEPDATDGPRSVDALAALAAAAGDDDPERWWDDVVERLGGGGCAVFAAVAEVMAAARGDLQATDARTARREAHMRSMMRDALDQGHPCIAVVCGAWHVPALTTPWPSASADARLLRGVGRGRKSTLAWVPWTHLRLATATGYRAGVESPGWYDHVFRWPGAEGLTRWFVSAARLLRDRGFDVSPDHLIAASRLAATLATMRGRPHAGLHDVLEAAETVLGGRSALATVRRELIVGDVIGWVSPDAPRPPLSADLASRQRAVRLTPSAVARHLELDVRTPTGRARSVLLHQLTSLGVPWGTLSQSRSSTGTFRETWLLCWEPEFDVLLVERAALGTTVTEAATAAVLAHAAVTASSPAPLATLVGALEQALLADLVDAVAPLVTAVDRGAAHDVDLGDVVDALLPLARTIRYGDVRATDEVSLRRVFDVLVSRVLAGVVTACRSLADSAAATMATRLDGVQAALALLDHPMRRGEWPAVLAILTDRPDVHGAVQGRATRLLHDAGVWPRARVASRLGRALGPGVSPGAGAAFVDGLLAGSGALLIHDEALLTALDEWIVMLPANVFVDVVPLVRRVFGEFESGERRHLGRLLAQRGGAAGVAPDPTADAFGAGVDPQRAAAGIDVVRHLLGVGR